MSIKKFIKKFALVAMVFGVLGSSFAITHCERQINIFIDGQQVPLDDSTGRPILTNNTTLVPMRVVSEYLNYEVEWTPESKIVTINGDEKGDETEVRLQIGNKVALVNNQDHTLLAAPSLHKNRTYVPFRFVGETYGYEVKWDSDTSSVIFRSKGYTGEDMNNSNGSTNSSSTNASGNSNNGNINNGSADNNANGQNANGQNANGAGQNGNGTNGTNPNGTNPNGVDQNGGTGNNANNGINGNNGNGNSLNDADPSGKNNNGNNGANPNGQNQDEQNGQDKSIPNGTRIQDVLTINAAMQDDIDLYGKDGNMYVTNGTLKDGITIKAIDGPKSPVTITGVKRKEDEFIAIAKTDTIAYRAICVTGVKNGKVVGNSAQSDLKHSQKDGTVEFIFLPCDMVNEITTYDHLLFFGDDGVGVLVPNPLMGTK